MSGTLAEDPAPARTGAAARAGARSLSILFVGDLRAESHSHQRMAALRGLGHDVEGVSWSPVVDDDPDGPPPGLLDRVAHHIGRPRDTARVNRSVLESLARRTRTTGRPHDLIWVDKGPTLRPATLRAARDMAPGIRLAFHSEDDVAARHNQSAWLRGCLPLYDIVFTAKSFHLQPQELPALGVRRIEYRPQAFDPRFHRPLEVDRETVQRLGARVGFIGTYEEARAASMLHVARHGVEVRVWGNGWERGPRHANLRIERRAIYGEDYVRCLCATDINLGFLRKANRDLHTTRSLEIPACGAFMLAERTGEHVALFAEGREADYFGDDDELLAKVRWWLDHDAERRTVARAGRERCLAGGYDLPSMLRAMLASLEAGP